MTATLSPPPLHATGPLLGGMREFTGDQVDFLAATRESGDTVFVEIGPPGLRQKVCILHTATAAETVLSATTGGNFTKEAVPYQQLRLVVGNGILTAQGDDWLDQKRFVQPSFTKARVDGYLGIMVEEIDHLASTWRTQSTVSLDASMRHLTLRVVCRTLFGRDVDALEPLIVAEVPKAAASIIKRASVGGKIPLAWPLPVNNRLRASRERLYATVDQLIADRRRTGERGDDLLSLLLDARDGDEQLSDHEVRDQTLIFLLAGHETSASSLTFALHLLGRHPEIQQRVRDEVATIVGDKPPSAAQVHAELPYTTAVIKEAMRLYPIVPFIPRHATEECEIDGFAIPAQTDILVAAWSIHHDPAIWPDPDSFQPERFLGRSSHDRYAWLPFGAGPRACIGQHFAMMEAVAALALLTRSFELESLTRADRVPINSAMSMFPKEPLRAAVRPQ